MHSLKVLRKSELKSPKRCCGCGLADLLEDALVSAPPNKDGAREAMYGEREKFVVRMCQSCRRGYRWHWWMAAFYFFCTGIIVIPVGYLAVLLLAPEHLQNAFPVLVGIQLIVPGLLVYWLNPSPIHAVFDEHWTIIGFRNQAFAQEFYLLNRKVARLTDER